MLPWQILCRAKKSAQPAYLQPSKGLGLGRSYDAAANFIAGIYHARTGQKKLAIKLFDQCIQTTIPIWKRISKKA
jgi:hypothetical protein